MALIGNTNEERVWNYLKNKEFNDFGIAGLMGNIAVESGFNPKNLQGTANKSLGITDDEYTARVDSGEITKEEFVNLRAGYSICQWTYPTRKRSLYEFAKSQNKSIGDLEMALDFMYKEISEYYKSVFNVLKTATSVRQASDAVMLKYEKPANQSESNQENRAKYGLIYYNKYHKDGQTGGGNTMAINQTFTNSNLVSFTQISPNKTSPRNHVIDTITIHCYVGQVTVERMGKGFAVKKKNGVSCNYGIGLDGRIGMYVEEKDRSWCSSNRDNDHRAITIEVACDKKHPYAVKDVVLKSLIELVADICKRNNIKELKWKADKSLIGQVDKQNMTVHRWFASKSCPGKYLYDKHYYIAEEVNKRLGITSENNITIVPDANSSTSNNKADDNSTPTSAVALKVGDEVKLVAGATYASGKPVSSWVFKKTLYVRKLYDDNAVVSTLKTGAVTGKVPLKYLEKIGQGTSANSSLPYKVKINSNALNIRVGAGKNYKSVGYIKDRGVYTIVEEKDGQGASKWLRLSNNAGWISADFCEKI